MVNKDYLDFFVEIWMKHHAFEGSLYDVFPRFRGYKIFMEGDRNEAYVALEIKTRLGGQAEQIYLKSLTHLITEEFVDSYQDSGDSTYLSLVYDISEFIPNVIRIQLWNARFIK